GAPTVAFRTGRPTALSLQLDSAARIKVAVVPLSIVRGARDGSNAARSRSPVLVRIDGKISPTAVIHPHSSAVKPPAIALVASRTAAWVHHPHSAPCIRRAIVAMAIFGGASERLRRASRTENDKC